MPSTPTHKNLGSLIEASESPIYEIGETITQTRIYHATISVCLANIVFKGTAGTGAQSGYQVQRCTVTSLGGSQGRLTLVWEANASGSGATLPPDEVAVQADNQSPRVERHPIFKPLEDQKVGAVGSEEYVLDLVENAVRAQTRTDRETALGKLAAVPLALKLIKKLQRGQESYYAASLRTAWVTHSWDLPSISRGGFRDPVQGPLAGYFVSDIDWLREADDLQYSNGIWRWTRSWLGSPEWDPDIYTA